MILAGVGETGIVARKMVAAFNSDRHPGPLPHPVEAMHGDLGMVSRDDVVLALSNSGETQEITILLPSLQRLGSPLISFTGRPNSTLGRASLVVIDTGVPREACPLGLAPTASTTAMLAMGDALAVVLLTKRGFQASDFQRFHPGGSLGSASTWPSGRSCSPGASSPAPVPPSPWPPPLQKWGPKNWGPPWWWIEEEKLAGIVTDGDLRRALGQFGQVLERPVKEVMTADPLAVGPETLASQALELMEKKAITVLPVVDDDRKVVGIVHLHDLLGRGEFKFTV